MLKLMVLKKRHKKMMEEAAQLRAKQAGFATREADLAAQIEAASTDEEIAAAAAAVAELEEAQKTTKERLDTIIAEAEAIQKEIADAEAAAAAAGAGDGGDDGTGDDGTRSRRSVSPEFQRRCQEFQRTGRMAYGNLLSFVKRAAVLISSAGVAGPKGVGEITDAADSKVSGLLDLIKITDCTGLTEYEVPYEKNDPTANEGADGEIPTESEPEFGSVVMKPILYDIISYISRRIKKLSPLQYESKVRESVNRALRRILTRMVTEKVLASELVDTKAVSAKNGALLFTPHLLSDIILSYGGDESVDGAATLVLPKADLKAFAAVRGTNEFLPVYSIIPDASNPSTGIIKDNNGLSCRYCLDKYVPALSTAPLSATATKGMFYGSLSSAVEMGLWGNLEVTADDSYQFGKRLVSIMGEVMADAGVVVSKGVVVVSATLAS